MKIISTIVFLFVSVTALLTAALSEANEKKYSVLVLNSYHPGFTWTDHVMKGITNEFSSSILKTNLFIEYMDAKRFYSSSHSRNIKNYILNKYRNTKIDIIITSDNAALEAALSMRQYFIKKIPIVFCGYNGDPSKLLVNQKNITGIIEKWNPSGTVKIIREIQKGVKKLYLIHDQTESGLATLHDFIEKTRGHNLDYESCGKSDLNYIIKKISSLPDDYAVILLGYNRSSEGKVLNSEQSGEIFGKTASVPVYTMDESRFTEHIMGGDMLSGYQQGETAAEIAIDILNGNFRNSQKIISDPLKNPKLNYRMLSYYNIKTSGVPKYIQITGSPASLYEKYKSQVWIVFISILSLATLSVALLASIIIKKRLEKEKKYIISSINESMDIFIVLNSELVPVFMNRSGFHFFGFNDSIENFKISRRIPSWLILKMKNYTCDGSLSKSIWNGETDITGHEKIMIPFFVTIMIHCYNKKNSSFFSIVLRDISQFKRINTILLESKQNLKTTLDSIGDSVIITDQQGRITKINPSAEKLTGIKQHLVFHKKIKDIITIFSEENTEETKDIFEELITGKPKIFNSHLGYPAKANDKEKYIAYTSSKIISKDDEIIGCIFVIKDITEETELQNRLRHAQKMEAVGQLAGGISHDFNNILSVIMGSSQVISTLVDENSEIMELSRQIFDTSKQASDLIRQLLILSRNDEARKVKVNFNSLLDETTKLLTHTIGKNIKISHELLAADETVLGDPVLFQNALINLSVNARDAMEGQGQIMFLTRNVKISMEHKDQFTELKPGNYIEVSVSDTGKGMTREIQKKIFNPYFTTKPAGQGTGLGLSTVFGIIERYGGHITLYSQPGHGTTFKILLPIIDASENNSVSDNYKSEENSGIVMLIDDEAIILSYLSEVLKKNGFRTECFIDTSEAVSFYKENYQKIILTIIDLNLAGTDGIITAEELKKINPQIKIIISTGYTHDKKLDVLKDKGIKKIIHKPHSEDEVMGAVNQLLNE